MSPADDVATNFLINRKIVEARKFFENKIRTNSELALSHAGLSICLSIQGSLIEAEKEIELSRLTKDTEPLGFVASAMLEDIKNNHELSKKHFQQALDFDPNHVYVLYTFGTFLIRRGEINEGIDLLLQATSITEHQWTIRQNLSIGYAKIGKYSNALREAWAAYLLKPSRENLKLIALYAVASFPYAIWLIVAIPAYLFIVNPKSILALVLFLIILFAINIAKYILSKNRTSLVISILTLALGVLYYFLNIK